MLVLTRRIGESIIIGNGIKLTVVNVGPGRVKIGIEAPPSVRVDREEVHSRIQQEQHEKATDVLASLSADAAAGAAGDQPTLVSAGPDTGVLHSGDGTGTAGNPAPAGTPTPAPVNRLSQFRAPRKPR